MGWDEDKIHDIGLKIVILTNFFTEEEVLRVGEQQDAFFQDLEAELRGEIET